MSKYVTLVIRMPEGPTEKQQVLQAMQVLEPFQTAKSLEDEMTVLELIEQHPDFDESIADEARAQAAKLHIQSEAVTTDDEAVAEWQDAMDRERP
ncbi:hypothetical protein [Chromobacterium haemolyticum]|uniref:hypothetical protein n=1 Tax=Chromobacterium haemolyticum TaxID=394935 RepID=UPI002446B07D|nr:hypothetical protein [Chromobacterium haemolyticum]MDH0342028.1 hypothetical protein [Chromobacterium haemolyticum]